MPQSLAMVKASAQDAVVKIEAVLQETKYTLPELEDYGSKDDLLKAVEPVDGIIIRGDIVDPAVLEKAGKLKICVRAGTDYANIDLTSCEKKSVGGHEHLRPEYQCCGGTGRGHDAGQRAE